MIGLFITLVIFCLFTLTKMRFMFVQYCECKWALSVSEEPVYIIVVSDIVRDIFWSFTVIFEGRDGHKSYGESCSPGVSFPCGVE